MQVEAVNEYKVIKHFNFEIGKEHFAYQFLYEAWEASYM